MGTHPLARNLRPGRAAACGACFGEGGMSSKKLSDTVKMVELYRKGQTLRDIADVFGCSMQNVHRRLQDCCEPMRPRGWRKRQPVFCMHYGQKIGRAHV